MNFGVAADTDVPLALRDGENADQIYHLYDRPDVLRAALCGAREPEQYVQNHPSRRDALRISAARSSV
jgi:hypothetical protein